MAKKLLFFIFACTGLSLVEHSTEDEKRSARYKKEISDVRAENRTTSGSVARTFDASILQSQRGKCSILYLVSCTDLSRRTVVFPNAPKHRILITNAP
jgi:hypothetical protein